MVAIVRNSWCRLVLALPVGVGATFAAEGKLCAQLYKQITMEIYLPIFFCMNRWFLLFMPDFFLLLNYLLIYIFSGGV